MYMATVAEALLCHTSGAETWSKVK